MKTSTPPTSTSNGNSCKVRRTPVVGAWTTVRRDWPTDLRYSRDRERSDRGRLRSCRTCSATAVRGARPMQPLWQRAPDAAAADSPSRIYQIPAVIGQSCLSAPGRFFQRNELRSIRRQGGGRIDQALNFSASWVERDDRPMRIQSRTSHWAVGSLPIRERGVIHFLERAAAGSGCGGIGCADGVRRRVANSRRERGGLSAES